MAKKRKTYTADEMRAVQKRLATHKGKLIDTLAIALQTAIDFDTAVLIRDEGQHLLSTVHALDTLSEYIGYAEKLNESRMLPFKMEDCGLED